MIKFGHRRKTPPKVNRLRINLIGWYGKGGLADDIIQYCIKEVFYEEALKSEIRIEYVDSIDCDLIVIGGGSLLGVDCLNIAQTIRKAKTPLVIYGTGFRREHRELDSVNKKSTSKILKKASLKGVRGFLSKTMFLHNRIPVDKVSVIGDPGILFKPVPVADFIGEFKVSMVVRNVKGNEPQYVPNERIQKIFSELADYLVEKFCAKIFFLSFTENYNESDTEGANKTVELMKHKDRIEILPRIDDCVKLGSILGKMDLIVSQRLHPSLLGWVQGIPNIAFEYQFNKTADFMNSIGMDEFVIRTEEFVLENYLKKFEFLLKEKHLIVTQSQNVIKYWVNKQKEFTKRCIDLAIHYQQKR